MVPHRVYFAGHGQVHRVGVGGKAGSLGADDLPGPGRPQRGGHPGVCHARQGRRGLPPAGVRVG